MTLRLIDLLSRNPRNLYFKKISDLYINYNKYFYVNDFVHMEDLENNLIEVLNKFNEPLNDDQIKYILSKKSIKTNISTHLNFSEYYDNNIIDLVYQKDKLIFDLFYPNVIT